MAKHNIFTMSFAKVYPMYVQQAERKSRAKAEVDFTLFFAQAPELNPHVSMIKGLVCGIQVEDVEDPLMQKIRYLDKPIDELAKGKAMDKILRQ